MLDVLVEEPPANLEEDVPLPPRKPRNTMRKCAVKKMMVSRDTREQVTTSTSAVRYSSSSHRPDDLICLLQSLRPLVSD
jgi:hypothetical protein